MLQSEPRSGYRTWALVLQAVGMMGPLAGSEVDPAVDSYGRLVVRVQIQMYWWMGYRPVVEMDGMMNLLLEETLLLKGDLG